MTCFRLFQPLALSSSSSTFEAHLNRRPSPSLSFMSALTPLSLGQRLSLSPGLDVEAATLLESEEPQSLIDEMVSFQLSPPLFTSLPSLPGRSAGRSRLSRGTISKPRRRSLLGSFEAQDELPETQAHPPPRLPPFLFASRTVRVCKPVHSLAPPNLLKKTLRHPRSIYHAWLDRPWKLYPQIDRYGGEPVVQSLRSNPRRRGSHLLQHHRGTDIESSHPCLR